MGTDHCSGTLKPNRGDNTSLIKIKISDIKRKLGKLNLAGKYGGHKKEMTFELNLNWMDGIYSLR